VPSCMQGRTARTILKRLGIAILQKRCWKVTTLGSMKCVLLCVLLCGLFGCLGVSPTAIMRMAVWCCILVMNVMNVVGRACLQGGDTAPVKTAKEQLIAPKSASGGSGASLIRAMMPLLVILLAIIVFYLKK